MKKKIITILLIGTMAVSLLAGCTPVDREAQESYRQLGITQLQEGDYEGAVTNFQKALDESLGKIGPHEVDICYYKALAQFKAGDINGAIETYTSLLEYDEDNAEAYYLRGCAYLQAAEGEADEAKATELSDKGIMDYNQAVAIDSDNYDLYLGIYENLNALGRETYAQDFLSRVLSLSCSSAQEYCNQGYVYLVLGEYDKAAPLLEKAVVKGCDEAMLYQAQILSEQGDVDQAKALIQAYSDKYPEDVDALHQGAVLALNAKQYEEAVKMLEQAYSYAGKDADPELQLNLIYAYEYSGQFNKAYELMSEYVKQYPGDAEAAREYEFLKTRTGTGKTPAERAEAEAQQQAQAGATEGDTSTDTEASTSTDAESATDTSATDNTSSDSTTDASEDSDVPTIDGTIVL